MAATDRKPALLGIDVGTSSAKLLLYFLPRRGREPEPPRVARAEIRARRASGDASELPPAAWWRAVRTAAGRLDTSGARVLGIGLSTLFPALVAIDPRGKPLRPAILYDDRRSAPLVEALGDSELLHPSLLHLLTGNVVRAGTVTLSSLLWMRRHEPKRFERAALFGHASSYLGLALTGRFAMDAASAGLSGLYATASGEAWLRGILEVGGVDAGRLPKRLDAMTYEQYLELLALRQPRLREQVMAEMPPGVEMEKLLARRVDLPGPGWIAPVADAAGIHREQLPPVLRPTDRLGSLTAEAADALGLEAGIPVAMGAGDTICGALGLGLGVEGESEMVALCGSTDSLVALQRSAVFSTRTVNTPYLDAETWLAIAPMNATGAAVDWFIEMALGRGRKRYERFYDLVSSAPAGSRGAVFLPYLAGERSPVYDPSAKGVFFGLTLETGTAEMARAVLEGIAFGHRQILDMTSARLGRPIERVIAAGGGLRHALARQIRADAADRPYLYADLADVAALGAALLGGVASGALPDWKAAAEMARGRLALGRTDPSPEAWHDLKRNYDVYCSLYEALRHCHGG